MTPPLHQSTRTIAAMHKEMPLLVKLSISPPQRHETPQFEYDADSETIRVSRGPATDEVWLTGSYLTAADEDPTHDEPCDR